MALVVRCAQHGLPRRTRHTEYVFGAEPSGGPNPTIHCGKKGCKNPGLVFMDIINAMEYRSGRRTFNPHFSHPERGVRLRPVPRAVLEAPQSGMCTPRTGVQEPEADSGYGNAQRGVLVKIDAAQGTAPQGLSRGKAFQALLEIGAAEGRSINPAQLPANSRGPARTNSPTGN